jgi:gluconolactonase
MAELYDVYDERFRRFIVGSARLETLHTGMVWGEGPVYFADGDYLLFSDIPNNALLKWTPGGGVTTYRHPSNFANGNTRDRQGRLISCEHGRRLTRTEIDGTITVLAETYQGKRLNSPNDVVVKSDDSIWFTDPPYGILSDFEGIKGDSELGANYVFRLDPATGDLDIATDACDMPNGLAFSTDESLLYVANSGISEGPGGSHHIDVFDVVDGRRLENCRHFATIETGAPDGFRLDTEGYVWSSCGDGVVCIDPDGAFLGKIRIPECVANVTFGGPKKNRLFIAGESTLFAIYLNCTGQQWP